MKLQSKILHGQQCEDFPRQEDKLMVRTMSLLSSEGGGVKHTRVHVQTSQEPRVPSCMAKKTNLRLVLRSVQCSVLYLGQCRAFYTWGQCRNVQKAVESHPRRLARKCGFVIQCQGQYTHRSSTQKKTQKEAGSSSQMCLCKESKHARRRQHKSGETFLQI